MIPKPITISITDSQGQRFTAELHYDSNIEDIMNAVEANEANHQILLNQVNESKKAIEESNKWHQLRGR